MPPPAIPEPRRRRWALSVRGLMLLVLVVGGLIGREANRVSRMRRAVAVLERPAEGPPGRDPDGNSPVVAAAETDITYDDGYEDGTWIEPPRPPRFPGWVLRIVGVDHFRRVTVVNLRRRPTPADWDAIADLGSVERLSFGWGSFHDFLRTPDLDGLARCPGLRDLYVLGLGLTDEAMAGVGRLRDLRKLDLRATSITDAGLARLAGLTRLEVLQLPSRAGTDAGLAHLRGMRNLRILGAGCPEARVGDAGLAHLRGMERLEELEFLAGHLTDAGMAILEGLPRLKDLRITANFATPDKFALSPAGVERLDRFARLETLHLSNSGVIDDAWLRPIGRLTTLRDLQLSGSEITDAGLAPLGNLIGLAHLLICSPLVTDAGLAHLRPLTRLADLSFYARVSDAGLAGMQAAIPTLKEVSQAQWVERTGQSLPSRSRRSPRSPPAPRPQMSRPPARSFRSPARSLNSPRPRDEANPAVPSDAHGPPEPASAGSRVTSSIQASPTSQELIRKSRTRVVASGSVRMIFSKRTQRPVVVRAMSGRRRRGACTSRGWRDTGGPWRAVRLRSPGRSGTRT